MNDDEYLFIATGIMHSMNTWGMMLGSSDKSNNTLSFYLNDNVYPPYMSHKFIREDAIKIRDYINRYLSRTDAVRKK